jgi:hypothetical protein
MLVPQEIFLFLSFFPHNQIAQSNLTASTIEDDCGIVFYIAMSKRESEEEIIDNILLLKKRNQHLIKYKTCMR